jgi:hypothetical protein
VAFVVVNVIFLTQGVARRGGDTLRYADGAARLVRGESLSLKQMRSISYVLPMAALRVCHVDSSAIVILQLGAAAWAARCLRRLGNALAGPTAGTLAALFAVANPDIAQWHVFILPESLYTSFVVITVATLARISRERTPGNMLAAFVATIITATLRPNGWLMVPVGLSYFGCGIVRGRAHRAVVISSVATLFCAAVLLFPPTKRVIDDEGPGAWLKGGVVVWGDEASRVPMPASSLQADDLGAMLSYAIQYPKAALGLASRRVLAELAHVRHFYSWRHNLAIAVLLVPLYGLALVGFKRHLDQPLAWLLAAVVSVHLALVALTIADWDGRLLIHVLPEIGVLSSAGLVVVAARRKFA